ESVARIPTLAQMRTSSPIAQYLPAPLVQLKFVDTSLWQWIALILAGVIFGSLSRAIFRILLFILKPLLRRVAPHVNWGVLDRFVGPFQLLLWVGLFRGAMAAINPSALVRLYLGYVLGFLTVIAVAWLCMRIVDLSATHLRSKMDLNHQTFARAVLPLTSRVVKIAIVIFAVAAVLDSWGHPPTTLLAGVGIGGIAVALAAQKTVENLFGGVSVISDRPVFVGDYCKFGESAGTVEDIGLRSTRIRTADRTLMVVPNSQFSTMTLENFSRRDKILFHPTLNLRRDTSPDQVRMVLESFQKILGGNPKIESGGIPVRFVGVGTYSLDIEIFVYILTQDFNEFLHFQQDLLLRILDAVAAAGTALALPTQASIWYPSGHAIPGQGYPEIPAPDNANPNGSSTPRH
ncbi:MAG TPA: mechanosensitive ion channel family protein, partial [Bryobacteraceae bacterium]|nr:mechanosensitive ion channel family protein [Bryobacteraceae bacterium]